MNSPISPLISDGPLVQPFPTPGQRIYVANRDLHLSITGTPEQRDALGDPARLPRPWLLANTTDAALRAELWQWLEEVVTWLNHQYVWHPEEGLIPPCWPEHPHLIHEIAVLADQRWRVERDPTSDAMEDWHRYSLPMFTDRMRRRLRGHCADTHQPSPSRPGNARHRATTPDRTAAYAHDVCETHVHVHAPVTPDRARLHAVPPSPTTQ